MVFECGEKVYTVSPDGLEVRQGNFVLDLHVVKNGVERPVGITRVTFKDDKDASGRNAVSHRDFPTDSVLKHQADAEKLAYQRKNPNETKAEQALAALEEAKAKFEAAQKELIAAQSAIQA